MIELGLVRPLYNGDSHTGIKPKRKKPKPIPVIEQIGPDSYRIVPPNPNRPSEDDYFRPPLSQDEYY